MQTTPGRFPSAGRITAAAFALAVLLVAPGAARAQSALDEAKTLYDGAKFTQAVTILRDALATGRVAGTETLKAKEWLGRCLVKAGNRIEAKEAFKSLLRTDDGYRLDAVTVPPDEMEVFNDALKEITAEEIEAGQRVPASIGLFFGAGSGKNQEFADFVKDGGGDDAFDASPEFGGSVRFPLLPRFSLDIELSRFRATNSDSGGTFSTEELEYEITAIPLLVSLYWTALPHERWRVNVFGGLGPLMATRVSFKIPGSGNSVLTISDERQGFIGQVGVEGEYLIGSRFSVSGRVLARQATASGFYENTQLDLYVNDVFLDDRKASFSGIAANVALRAYIGY